MPEVMIDAELHIAPEEWEREDSNIVESPSVNLNKLDISFPKSLEINEDESNFAASNTEIINKKIASWKDPLTPPHVKLTCVKWAYPWPGAKICIGHKYEFRWMYCEVRLVVTGPSADGLKNVVNDCLQTSAVVAAAAAIIAAVGTGGAALPAAKAAFLKIFEICLKSKLAGAAIGVNLEQSCAWGDWE
ncbi:hypothetical protein H5395_15720 [Paracoccus sp. MC1854]|uniref:hypothetical protein n=1 Tax=Paracoccus sp. MC1854 TaxID=2760306 RepID=UPI0016007E4F|nr:hypothetical protein [Paracoccus sp. MC1854]MBB1492938.1 hypothetical protein [Paracoccus sp. MC1854]